MRFRIVLLVLAALGVRADVRQCICQVPPEATQRGCSLCVEAEKHPASETIILIHDNDPLKMNRWLAVPRARFDGANFLAQMSPEERLALWTAAIGKGKEVWGNDWGVAMNGDVARRQCHAHIHIGKLIANEDEDGFFVDGPASLPASDETGFWFHPVGTRLHVHRGIGDQNNEQFLLK